MFPGYTKMFFHLVVCKEKYCKYEWRSCTLFLSCFEWDDISASMCVCVLTQHNQTCFHRISTAKLAIYSLYHKVFRFQSMFARYNWAEFSLIFVVVPILDFSDFATTIFAPPNTKHAHVTGFLFIVVACWTDQVQFQRFSSSCWESKKKHCAISLNNV